MGSSDEEIGIAMGYSDEDVEMKQPVRAVVRPVQFGTTTYVKGGDSREDDSGERRKAVRYGSHSEEVDSADFVYGYGIRATTVVTTKRE